MLIERFLLERIPRYCVTPGLPDSTQASEPAEYAKHVRRHVLKLLLRVLVHWKAMLYNAQVLRDTWAA
jgi:hypothetical protein